MPPIRVKREHTGRLMISITTGHPKKPTVKLSITPAMAKALEGHKRRDDNSGYISSPDSIGSSTPGTWDANVKILQWETLSEDMNFEHDDPDEPWKFGGLRNNSSDILRPYSGGGPPTWIVERRCGRNLLVGCAVDPQFLVHTGYTAQQAVDRHLAQQEVPSAEKKVDEKMDIEPHPLLLLPLEGRCVKGGPLAATRTEKSTAWALE